ncbi:MAG: DPP IV N-terminal domain-containing protein, partial [Saprospiraceae bacterium]|nr:DPP IV N-terminal domain-containing protein [Saprospiraceae bacterium]
MEKLLREYGFLFAFILLSGVTSGQESFEGWVSEDQALISRSEGTHRSEILLDLSKNNKEHERRSEEPFRSGYMEPMALPDGSLVQLLGHDLYLIKADGEKFQLTDDDSEEKNAQLSPDKTKVAYTKDHNLYMYDLSQHTEKQLTSDGSESVYNGWASWVYYEEILGRSSHYSAFWWSPDNEKIAFLHFDDAPVPTFPIFYSFFQHDSLEVDHYPKAGDPNPDVQFAIADVSSGKITWVSEDPDKDQYSALPFWSPQGKH